MIVRVFHGGPFDGRQDRITEVKPLALAITHDDDGLRFHEYKLTTQDGTTAHYQHVGEI